MLGLAAFLLLGLGARSSVAPWPGAAKRNFCTRNGVRMDPGDNVKDAWGIKECFIRWDGRPAFRYVACVVGGKTVGAGEEVRQGAYFHRCDITDGRINLAYSACATSTGARVGNGEEVRDGSWYFRCTVNDAGQVRMRPSACVDATTGARVANGGTFVQSTRSGHRHLMRCRISPDGAIRYESAGCQRDGVLVPPGTEYLTQGGHFWRRCVEEDGVTRNSVVACNNGGEKVPSGQPFLRTVDRGTSGYWRKCVIEADGSYRVTLEACNDPATNSPVRPGDSWTEGAWVKTCEELNGMLTWRARWRNSN